MPNGEQALEQDHEGEDSAEESGEWESPADDDEDESDGSDDEEVVRLTASFRTSIQAAS